MFVPKSRFLLHAEYLIIPDHFTWIGSSGVPKQVAWIGSSGIPKQVAWIGSSGVPKQVASPFTKQGTVLLTIQVP